MGGRRQLTMTRQNTYDKYRSGKAARDARNTSEGKKSFIRMKQKFLPKETAVSSEGNFAHLSGSYRPACKLFALIAALLLLGANWNGVWGQTTYNQTITLQRYEQYGLNVQDIYFPGDISTTNPKKIRLQKAAGENIDGYIHWYIKKKNGTITTTGLQRVTNTNNYDQYNNGYVWIRSGDDDAALSNDQNSIAYNGTGWTEGDILVCEASSLNNATWEYDSNRRRYIHTSPMITVVHEYELKQASDRFSTLSSNRTKLNGEATLSSWLSNSTHFVSLIDKAGSYFMETYDIYTPLSGGYEERVKVGTNYRLEEELSNYYVSNDDEANQVRWSAFRSTGGRMTQIIKDKDDDEGDGEDKATIWDHAFGFDEDGIDLEAKTEQIVYITAEVSNDGSTWYPVAFMTVHLMPYYEALTVDDLDTKVSSQTDRANYYPRTETYLERNGYRKLNEVTFDDIPTEGQPNLISLTDLENNIELNYATQPMPHANTNYAFANPSEFPYRKKNRLSVGRGEYGLYRSLNYQHWVDGYWDTSGRWPVWIERHYEHVSKGEVDITEDGETGSYEDYFMKNNRYERYVFDRTYEKAGLQGSNMGYFLYLDATDEPGVITNMELTEPLCPNTKLIVTAWVCDLAHSESGLAHADIGFTFKGIKNNQETILAKYYSGKIINKPAIWNTEWSDAESNRALWQQVYFTFSYPGQVDDYDSFLVEIANNAPSSNGADYAIDDIQVWCSTPNIQVGRVNSCDASTLAINTDFETILENMGWNENQEVTTGFPFENLDFLKYRYGLMGESHSDPEKTNSTVGNAYFSFFGGSRANPKWVIVNNSKDAADVPAVRNTIRVAISTVINDIPASEEIAERWERELNARAVEDYNADIDKWKAKDRQDGTNIHTDVIPVDNIRTDDAAYETAIKTLYTRLGIPRIRCPWRETVDGQVILHLTELQVADTDMKYVGQVEGDNDAGHYFVILFRASEIASASNPSAVVNPGSTCALVSDFYVTPATDILIEADAKAETALCLGAYRNITPALVVYDDEGQQITDETELDNILGSTYIFDWYLSTSENYDLLTEQFKTRYSLLTDLMKEVDEKGAVKAVIDRYRSRGGNEDTSEITAEEVRRWMTENPNNPNIQACGTLLLDLLAPKDGSDPLLRTGTPAGEVFKLQVNSKQIMAMPYVQAVDGYLICTTASPVDLPVSESFIPIILSGIHDVDYQTSGFQDASVPLRLGLDNISENETDIKTLTLPIRSITKAENAEYLGLPTAEHISILLDDEANNYPPVGEITTLEIRNTDVANGTATLSFHLTSGAKKYLEEGGEYNLLIPFVQYGDADNDRTFEILASECDGWISLPIKVVPKYLTWKGGATGVWYNDVSSWAFSTKNELYNKSDVTHTAENTYTFSPLYFTKITIPEGSELTLEDKEPGEGVLTGLQDGATKDIEYDLAVEDNTGKIGAYYINKVSEIYFKPEAMLKRQQHLNYQKAWVEFEMEKNAKYWLASPLQDVFAGDMYAPKGTARQTTAAFTDIHYTDATPGYDRWNPAFYQKAWDKGITYYDNPTTTGGGYTAYPVSVVHSNWSIEYNNVYVPYALGKGFYASVEDFNNNAGEKGEAVALVRLPKADALYQYVTKAASTIAKRPNSGLLAKGDVTIILTDADTKDEWYSETDEAYYADGDGTYFLIGNPYMYPLDVQKFFSGNLKAGTTDESIFQPKYWTLQDGTSTATVGTPDVDFDDANAISELGQIAPMQAFFVELKESLAEGAQLEVKFTTDMMAEHATTRSMETKSYAATNPALTITAERGDMRSVAKLLASDKAENGYRASEDAVVLLDSELDAPMVYTVSGSRAAQVNAVKEISNVGLGVYNAGDEEATITISGISRMATPLYLYDAATRQSTRLEGDSYELRVSGDSHGRYFLRDAELGDELENTISIYSARPGEVIVSSLRPVKDIRVFALNGSQVRRFSVNTTRYTFTLPAGIYMIQATDGERGQTEKVLVR